MKGSMRGLKPFGDIGIELSENKINIIDIKKDVYVYSNCTETV